MIIISNEHPHHARTTKKMHPNLIQAHNHHYHQTKTSCRGDLYLKIFKTTKNFFLFWLNKLIILTRNHHFITKKKLSFIKSQTQLYQKPAHHRGWVIQNTKIISRTTPIFAKLSTHLLDSL